MAERRVGAGREQGALEDQCVPDPERLLAVAPAHGAPEERKGGDERHDSDRVAQLGEVVGAQITGQAERAVTADEEGNEKQLQVVPRQRSRREAGEGDGRPFGLVQEAEPRQPLRCGEDHGHHSGHHDADPGDSDAPARAPSSPAQSKEVRDAR